MAQFLALLSALCLGLALVTSRIGLRSIDARSGAAISVPTATVLFVATAPLTIDPAGFTLAAALWFALIGVFFPAFVTIVTFKSNEVLGPTVTSVVSGTTPLFAVAAAALLLGERVAPDAAFAVLAVVAGVGLLTWKPGAVRGGFAGWALLWPVSGALARGLAQVVVKSALVLWPNPFAATLFGYLVSTVTVTGADRLRRDPRPRRATAGIAWFMLTGVLNGGGVLFMYSALGQAPVSTVAPIIGSYPLVTTLVGAAVLHDERVSGRMLVGAVITVAAVAWLAASRTG